MAMRDNEWIPYLLIRKSSVNTLSTIGLSTYIGGVDCSAVLQQHFDHLFAALIARVV